MEKATRDDVQRLIAGGAQVVEVLPREEYEKMHIAGAISVPLKELGERALDDLDVSRAVVTYCHDFL
jgi:rhodanese-related sulfurtransferase